ncbi:MAG: hypothetical protein ACLFPV_16020 [Spirochaetaceae bacterium]
MRIPKLTAALILLAAITLTGAAPNAEAHQFRNADLGYVVDVPAGWEIAEAATPELVSFVDPNGVAVFQVFSFPGDTFDEPEEIEAFIRQQLGASGDSAPFVLNGREAVFADLTFTPGGAEGDQGGTGTDGGPEFRGYYAFVDREDRDYAVMSFAEVSNYDGYHDFLLTNVDSFAADEEGRFLPGPVSQFYYAYPPPDPVPQRLDFEGSDVTLDLDAEETEATQILIEREARILTAYGVERWGAAGEWVEAWKRFYRVIYRDNVDRLEGLATDLEGHFRNAEVPRSEIPARLLDWLQDFEYARTGTLSDLQSPTSSLMTRTGDCDALALIYIILLHHMDFDAILMVSNQHAHALAAVDVEGDGARYEYEGTQYLVAELTVDVELGMIHQDMADPAGWIPVRMVF